MDRLYGNGFSKQAYQRGLNSSDKGKHLAYTATLINEYIKNMLTPLNEMIAFGALKSSRDKQTEICKWLNDLEK